MCEPELREAFLDFFETLKEENCSIEAINRDKHSNVKVEMMEFCELVGANVNRGRNRSNKLKHFNLGFLNLPNFKLFMPDA